VRVIEYYPETDKYLIRPTIPLSDEEKLSTTGQLIVKSQHLVTDPPQERFVWTFALLYDGNQLTQTQASSFVEKIIMISDDFRRTQDEWRLGESLACQKSFGPILQHQIEQFHLLGPEDFHDQSLDFSQEMVAANINIMSDDVSIGGTV